MGSCVKACIVLVGLPGAGKSTVGRHLARKLGREFVDADQVIESRIGCSIREYFEQHGEDRFRDVEQQVLADLVSEDAPACNAPALMPAGRVLSTGGGAVIRPANRQVLREGGQVFYLRATPEELFRRLKHDRTRPLLQVADPLQKLRDLYAQRDPLYRECAHHILETGRPSVHTLVNMIQSQMELSAGAATAS